MRKENLFYLLGLSFIFLSSGCIVRTYQLTRDRVDQDLSAGNRGYLLGKAPSVEEKEKKLTRTTQVVEVEIGSPIKFEKMPKQKPQEAITEEKATAAEKTEGLQKTEEQPSEGNRGYTTQSVTPEIAEPKAAVEAGFEKYTVAKGDTLQKISQKFYGTTKKWQKIYEANKNVLKGPNKIHSGQVLNIPVETPKETKENLK